MAIKSGGFAPNYLKFTLGHLQDVVEGKFIGIHLQLCNARIHHHFYAGIFEEDLR